MCVNLTNTHHRYLLKLQKGSTIDSFYFQFEQKSKTKFILFDYRHIFNWELQLRSMKKKLLLLSAVCVLSLVTGCSNKNNNQQSSGENTSSEETPSSSSSTSQFVPTSDTFNPKNPDAVETTISNMISSNNKTSNTTKLYRITGTVQWPENTTYGNFEIVDKTGYIYVYGCSKQNSTITKSGSTYTYNNNKSFSSMNIKAGDEIVMEGLYVYYSGNGGAHEFNGYVVSVTRNGLSNITTDGYTTDEPTNTAGTYYSGISDSLTKKDLLKSLHNLMDTTHAYWTTYSALNNYFKSSDPHPNGNVKCFYSGNSTSSYNREHVWPQSLSGKSSSEKLYGEDHGGSDLHHLRPTISSYNSSRGNSPFGTFFGPKEGIKKVSYSGGGQFYYSSKMFEPADSMKGDVARIIMYMYVHYSDATGGNTQSYYGTMTLQKVMGPYTEAEATKLLRKWNADDPVSQEEINRNNYVYGVQHNRNPFIDHPKYADKIWG